MLRAIFVCAAATLPSLCGAQVAPGPVSERAASMVCGTGERPRLVVVISIDQFRGDYLTRLGDLFVPAEQEGKPGGFRFLMEKGAYFANARYEHYPLFTGPGHSVIMTGAHPCKSGIVGNEWWDPKARREVYCVEDRRYEAVGAGEAGKKKALGPGNLRCSTVGDELKLATAGRAKVVTLGLKDRAAILLGGHAQDLSLWFDPSQGTWVSSTAYCRDGTLPEWVRELNEEHIPDRSLGARWEPLVSAEVIRERTLPTTVFGKSLPKGFNQRFPHEVGAEKSTANRVAFELLPAANEWVLETAARAVEQADLGQDQTPDILAINLATNDYIGHAFGPNSPEALDLMVRTDRLLAAFLGRVAAAAPGGLSSVLVVVTGDHGVGTVPETAAGEGFGLTAGRFDVQTVLDTISGALTARFGEPPHGTWYSAALDGRRGSGAFLDGLMWLDRDAIDAAITGGKASSRRDIEQAACDAINGANIPGVYGCFGKTQILEGRLADTDLCRHLAKGEHPQVGADLIVLGEQNFLHAPMSEGHAASHGTPYAYDAHVPVLICGPGVVRPGVYLGQAAPSDIAPTLSALLGVEYPSGCDGRVLTEALVSP